MRISTLNSFFKDALKNLRRNLTSSIASIAIVMSMLFLLGSFLLFIFNIKMGIIGVYSEFEILVTLKDDIKITDQQNIYNKIKAANGVTDITFKNNIPLSASYIIKVNGSDDIPKVISQINELQGINEINGGKILPSKIVTITILIQLLGVILFLTLLVASFILIKNTLKLAMYTRRDEISIMQYLGATDWFIRWPFIFEGIIIGFLGAMSAVSVMYFLYRSVYRQVTPYVATTISFIDPSFILTTISWSFILIGIILGTIGSIFAIRKFLIV
ncbi:cell division protein FtsX [Clostridium gelidum]|uniref:Cell division protein FtsX n=1 Tax=Clostridium gelidum TaxID=704125 RepID=A0ABN6J2X8_9CLOT|nr:FtsX-like permease family protein [Clostridium gelidum]BCZ48103.1 cell division protein FtsX [Clostridium gelidum]